MMALAPQIQQKLHHLETAHRQLVDRVWLTAPKHRLYYSLGAILVVLALLASAHMRLWQYAQWQNDPDSFLFENSLVFSTTDAPYFMIIAKDIKAHGSSAPSQRLRNFPDNSDRPADEAPSLRDAPLLSVVISYLAKDASLSALFSAAHAMVPVTAAVTTLAVIFAFGAAGFWVEGAIAGLGSSLSIAYLGRTSAGRIDTDQLNLGFFYLITALIIWASRIKNLWGALACCAAAAIGTQLFYWWWPKTELNWVFLGGLLWVSFLSHRDWKRPLLLGAVFIAICGRFNIGLSVDVNDFTSVVETAGQLNLPNTFSTVTELLRPSFMEVITLLTDNIVVFCIAIIGLIGWAITAPTIAIVFLPAVLLGMTNIVFGNRVIFFAAPVVWFGWAWFGVTLTKYLIYRMPKGNQTRWKNSQLMAVCLGATSLFSLTYLTSTNPISKPFTPPASFSVDVIKGFDHLGDYVRQNDTGRQPVIASWWDYGYAATLFSRIPTLHDGGSQRGPKTHLIARALMSEDQAETAQILKFLGNDGQVGIAQNSASTKTLDAAFAAGPKNDEADIYLVLTAQMARWMPSISQLGLWDSEAGQPLPIHNGSNTLFYQYLSCTGDGPVIDCNGKQIDLQAGTVNGRAVLSASVQSDNGAAGPRINYRNPSGFFLQFHRLGNTTWQTQLVHPRLFKSAFNQLFYLGNFDPDYYTPLIDGFPHFRVYKIN